MPHDSPTQPDPIDPSPSVSRAQQAIRRQLIGYAVAFLVVLGAAATLALLQSRSQIVESGVRLAQSLAQVIEEQTARTLQTVDQRLQLAASDLEKLKLSGGLNEQSARLVLRAHGEELPFVRALWVMDSQGHITLDADEGNIGISLRDRAYFQIYLTAPQTNFYVGTPVRSRSVGTWLISASRRLQTPDGRFAGIIVAAIEPLYFDKVWSSVDIGQDDSIALFRRDGTLMTRSPFNDGAMAKSFAERPVFRHMLPSQAAGTYRDSSAIDGAERVFAYRTLASFPDLVVIVGRSLDSILAPWRQLAMLALIVWLAAAIAVIWLCVRLMGAWQERLQARTSEQAMARRMALATEAAAVGVWEWDLKTDHWIANATYFSMLGYEHEEGQHDRKVWLERVHPEDQPVVVEKMACSLAGSDAPYECEARQLHADGSYRWVQAIGGVIERDEAGKPSRMFGVKIDTTERKLAEQKRAQILERITDAFVALDLNWCYTYVNQRAGEMLGRSPDQLIGKHIWTEFPEGIGQKSHRVCERAMAEQQPAHIEEYYPSDDRWFENYIYPSPEGLSIYFHDVTARKNAEMALRQSEENLAITLQSIGDAVIATDAAGLVARMNPTAERLTGWGLAQAMGKPLSEVFRIINAQTRLAATDPVQQVLARGEVAGLANHTALLSRDGHEYQIFDSAAPMRNEKGQIVGVVLVFSDVTEQYRVREALVATTELLERTGAMAKVGAWEFDTQAETFVLSKVALRIHDLDPALPPPAFEQGAKWYRSDVQPLVRAAMYGAISQGTPFDVELPMVTDKGRPLWLRTLGTAVVENGKTIKVVGAVQDVTERKLAELQLAASEQALRDSALHTQTILDNLLDGVITIDDQGFIESFNQAAAAIFGYSPEEVLGRNVKMLMPEPHQSRHDGYLAHSYGKPQRQVIGAQREVDGLRKDGSVFPLSVSVTRITQGARLTSIGVVRDISEQRANQEEIHRLAFYDRLTNLPNRRLLLDRLQHAMLNSTRTERYGAVFLLDLDHFKQLNDSLGHEVGDALLKQVALRLLACVREGDSVARMGGDEFVVLLEGLYEHEREAASQARDVADKVLASLGQIYRLPTLEHSSTPSIGIVLFLGQEESVEELLKQADMAMYQAKSAGRNTACFFDPAMQAAATARTELEAQLRRGVLGDEFVLHYQIQVGEDGAPLGVEALVRWNHPTRGLVTPGHFITLAEETRLILPLGQWVLETACQQLVAWATQGATAHWTVAVNVSALQFAQPNFVANVQAALEKTGANPRLLKLELTESMLADDVEDVIRKMKQIKTAGVDFSLDDFGTGYSSLSLLKRLPLGQIKIDQSFVRDVLNDPGDAVVARTIVALGHSMGLNVIAEGVETQAQRDHLHGMGCDAFQGYYFGRPVAPDALLNNIDKNRLQPLFIKHSKL